MNPAPPERLRTAGKRLWRQTIAGVADGWRLDVKDLALVEEACRVRDTIGRLQRRIDREGVEVEGSNGRIPRKWL